jgi:hypothetical protein
MVNRKGSYHFGGRYTLMNISGSWNIYDRKTQNTQYLMGIHTFVKAQKELLKFKTQVGDRK